jgi:hypothetical protein
MRFVRRVARWTVWRARVRSGVWGEDILGMRWGSMVGCESVLGGSGGRGWVSWV